MSSKKTLVGAATAACMVATLSPAVALAESAPTDPRTCVEKNLVWVQVDYGAAKKSEGGCATKFSNGLEALQSAGFHVTHDAPGEYGVFIKGINGVDAVFEKTGTYWSYWDGTVNDQGGISYSYYMEGASTSKPEPGSVEAWVVNDGKASPSLTRLPDQTTEKPQPDTGSSKESKIALGVVGALAALAVAVAAAVGAGLIPMNLPF